MSRRIMVVCFAAFEVNLQTGELRKHGVRIKLQDQPFQILAMLLEHPGELVTRDQIKERLWPTDTFVEFDHGVNTAVRRLREALCDSADTPRFVETLPRRGYRFLAEARQIADRHELQPAVDPGGSVPSNEATSQPEAARLRSEPETRQHRRRARMLAVTVAGFVVVVVTVAVLAMWHSRVSKVGSVAVLPFVNEAKDPSVDYLAVGLPSRVIDVLSEIPSLRVASRNSAFRDRDRTTNLREIAPALNVRALVLGSIRRERDTLHITVEVVDVRDDRHLWGGEYTVRERELPVLENSIAGEIANTLHQPLTARMRTRIHPVGTSILAYDATLHGEYAMERRVNENFRVALAYFQRAIDEDPNYAPAYIGMAKAYSLLVAYGGMSGADAFPLAEASTLRALELEPNLSTAHAQNGFLLMNYHYDLKSAEREFQRAIELNPNAAETYHGYSVMFARMGRTDQAVAAIKRAEELDPLWPTYTLVLAQHYLDGKRYEDVLSLRKEREYLKKAHILYAEVFALMGRREQAVAELANIPVTDTTPPLTACLAAQALAMAGERTKAISLLNATLERQQKLGSSANQACTHYNSGAVYAALGDRTSMMKSLQAAEKDMDMKMGWLAVEPVFDAYRSDPDFKSMVRRVGTPR